jgi:hypothetical protein
MADEVHARRYSNQTGCNLHAQDHPPSWWRTVWKCGDACDAGRQHSPAPHNTCPEDRLQTGLALVRIEGINPSMAPEATALSAITACVILLDGMVAAC